jgi:hypothetical protein
MQRRIRKQAGRVLARALALALLAAALPLAGCGYALVGRGTNIPEDVKRVYLKPFEDMTARVRVDQILTQAVADELVTRQRFSVAASAQEADAELVGAVTGFDVRPVKFDTDQRATEYEITITAKVLLRRLRPAAAAAAPATAPAAPTAAPATAPVAAPTAPATAPAAAAATPAAVPAEEILWQNDRYQFRDSFPVETGDLGFFDRETPALESAAEKFAETMVTDLLEGF